MDIKRPPHKSHLNLIKFTFTDPPKVSVRVTNTQSQDDTVKVNEMSRVNMTCAVDANPPVDGTREWTKGSVSIYQVRKNSVETRKLTLTEFPPHRMWEMSVFATKVQINMIHYLN